MGRDRDIEKELQFHLDERAAELVAGGMAADEAQRRAQLELGGRVQTREAVRRHIAPRALSSVWEDVRYAARRLLANPGFTAAAIVTLAIGVAVHTAIFTVVNSILLRPLPVPDADRIVLMANHYPQAASASTEGFTQSAAPDYYDRLETMTVFEEQAMFDDFVATLQVGGVPVRVPGMAATPSLFRLHRVSPVLGRIFAESEGEPGNEQRAILSDGLARELFGAPAAALNGTVEIGGRPFTVVGVMPAGFYFMKPAVRFWIPLAFTPEQRSDNQRHSNNWYNVGRLKPGASVTQAQAQVDALNAALMEERPEWRAVLKDTGFFTQVDRLQDVMVRDVRSMLYVLWGGAWCVFLIAAVNLGNLAVARSDARIQEIATRLSLGAGRPRVARLLAVEGLVLASAGVTLGVTLGSGALRILAEHTLERMPRAGEIRIDGVVIATAVALAVIAGLVIGFMPAVRLAKVSLGRAQSDRRTRTAGREARAMRQTLVVAQVGLTFVLLSGAGLLLASFRNLLAVDPGFVAAGVVTGEIVLPTARYAPQEVRGFTGRLLEAIRRIPGVTYAGATTLIPLGGDSNDSVIAAEGHHSKSGESIISPQRAWISPGYFEAMGTPLARGRSFEDRDDAEAPPVVIIDERLANHFWPGLDPLGRRMFQPSTPAELLAPDNNTRWLTVVGVVRSVHIADLAGRAKTFGTYYLPLAQSVQRVVMVAAKTSLDPVSVAGSLRSEVAKLDPTIPLSDVRSMTERTATSLMPRRTAMIVGVAFAVVALFLSVVGVYGVLAYLVAQRTREIGIRVALGSSTHGIFALVLRDGLTMVGLGLGIGVAGTVALQGVMRDQVYGVSAVDPLVLTGVTATVALLAFVACALPARQAARLHPVLALNQQ